MADFYSFLKIGVKSLFEENIKKRFLLSFAAWEIERKSGAINNSLFLI